MLALKEWVESRTSLYDTPLCTHGMMKPHTRCGWFYAENSHDIIFFPRAKEISTSHFMNMDDYTRATFIEPQEIEHDWFEEDYIQESGQEDDGDDDDVYGYW